MLGLLIFSIAGPKLYPDVAVSGHISEEEAVAAARSYVESASKLSLNDTEPVAQINRRPDLIDSLQLRLGRAEALRRIRQGDVPAYYWEVRWPQQDGIPEGRRASVSLTLEGDPLSLSTSADDITPGIRHDSALAALPAVVLDTLAADNLSFGLNGTGEDGPNRVVLDRSEAVRLARYHLSRTALGGRELAVDSVFASGEDGIVSATVRFTTPGADLGEWYTADVEILPTGALIGLDPTFVQGPETDLGLAPNDLLEIGRLILFVLIGLILVVVFFRRINARLIDTSSALRDALVGGLAAGLYMSGQVSGGEIPSAPLEIAVIIVGIVMMSFAAAAFIFFISGAASSVARDRWDSRLRSLDLARRLFIRNVPVGVALVRGVLCGLALLGLTVLALLAIPKLVIHYPSNPAFFDTNFPTYQAVRAVSGKLFFALYVSFTGVLGVGALMHLRAKTPTASTIGIVVALGMLSISPFELRPFIGEILLSAVLGGVIAWMLWRYDILSVMATVFTLSLMGAALGGLSVPSTPEFTVAVLSVCAVGVVFALGLAGALSGKTSQEVPAIVPEYIEELAQRERLKRELELAREVQLSFLPPGNPDWPGLDIASICLPAHEVGGDYYDFFRIDRNRLGLVVGDVSGKGLQAAFYMTLMKGVLQSMISDERGPAAILSRSNQLFRMNAPRGAFMSMVLGIFDMRSNSWTFARAGHNPVLVHRASNDRPEVVKPSGAAIGLATDSMFTNSLEEKTLTLAKDDLVLIYTDGVTEAMNERRDLYDERRLEDVVARAYGRSAGDVIDAVVEDVHKFCGAAPRHDDMTMVAVRVTADVKVRQQEAFQTLAAE